MASAVLPDDEDGSSKDAIPSSAATLSEPGAAVFRAIHALPIPAVPDLPFGSTGRGNPGPTIVPTDRSHEWPVLSAPDLLTESAPWNLQEIRTECYRTAETSDHDSIPESSFASPKNSVVVETVDTNGP